MHAPHLLRVIAVFNRTYVALLFSVGPILVALNPFKWIPGIYDDAVKDRYADGQLNLSEDPHVFAMAHDSHVGLQLGKNQSLIISGESGAGKVCTRQCIVCNVHVHSIFSV